MSINYETIFTKIMNRNVLNCRIEKHIAKNPKKIASFLTLFLGWQPEILSAAEVSESYLTVSQCWDSQSVLSSLVDNKQPQKMESDDIFNYRKGKKSNAVFCKKCK